LDNKLQLSVVDLVKEVVQVGVLLTY